jgi:hypothetical protein
MMFEYAQRSFNAACLLAVRDPRAWKEFDLTADGFFRSFIAILFVVPLNILFDLFAIRLSQARAAAEGLAAEAGSYGTPEMVFSTVTLVIEWMIFPLVALYLLRYLGLQQRYAQYVIAHNWGRIVTELLNLPAIVLFSVGLISDQAATYCLFITLVLTLYYRFYIAQTALEVGWSLAMALSILQLLLTILFAVAVRNGAGLWLPA